MTFAPAPHRAIGLYDTRKFATGCDDETGDAAGWAIAAAVVEWFEAARGLMRDSREP